MNEDQARDAEALDRLAKSSVERFKARLDWEWKARFGLWTALGLATAFTIGTDEWRPTDADFRFVSVAMVLLVLIYGGLFSFPVHHLHSEDISLWIACEDKISKLIWNQDPVPRSVGRQRHSAVWPVLLSVGQFFVTTIFAAALVFAVHTKAQQAKVDKQNAANATQSWPAQNKTVGKPLPR